jgi:hypothetical protein
MRVWTALALVPLFLQITSCERAKVANTIGECSKQELLGYTPTPDEVQTHRTFPLPFISYPFNTKQEQWGMALQLRIDEGGRIACYSAKQEFGPHNVEINEERHALLNVLSNQRYTPFAREGKAVPAIVSERINERESPQRHVPLPQVSLDQVQIALERATCYGRCPAYSVTVRGNGRVTYVGEGFVDVIGKHEYEVPRNEVAHLVDLLRQHDIWSLRTAYRADITDFPIQTLTITLGGETRTIMDYAGELAGMPSTIKDFENTVDKVGRALEWTHLSMFSMEQLAAEHYNFRSQASADMLARATGNDNVHDESAIVRLVRSGAPIEGGLTRNARQRRPEGSPIQAALENQLEHVANELISRGALRTADHLDPKKLDAAFRAAIRGGRLALVQKIWVQDTRQRPALAFDDVTDDEPARTQRSDVILLLSHHTYERRRWEGLQIAKWLVENGSDLRARAANGTTLLHIAAEAGDEELVRHLLAQGIDPSTPGRYELPALASTRDEDVAMVLLEAGTDPTRLNDGGSTFLDYAEYNHWARVCAWLREHGRVFDDQSQAQKPAGDLRD